jgi:hypothetical protein
VIVLGQLLFESRGRITGQRVLSVENGNPKVETSIEGAGIFTGSLEVTTTWTYWAIQRHDGTSSSTTWTQISIQPLRQENSHS